VRALLACAIALTAGPALTAPHLAATEPERALNATLRIADKDEKEFDNLFQGRGDPKFHQTVDYRQFLTAPLLAAIAAEQRKLLKADCGGKYLEGDECGLDYDPITCAQDTPPHHLFDTVRADANVAVINETWPGEKKITTYRMVHRSGHWLIDGIRCADSTPAGGRFNMP
jgi:hypothetical protein